MYTTLYPDPPDHFSDIVILSMFISRQTIKCKCGIFTKMYFLYIKRFALVACQGQQIVDLDAARSARQKMS